MTTAQMKCYRRLVARAAFALGLSSEEREEYRLAVLKDETGKESSTLCNNTSEFEAVMRRHAADAGDWDLAAAFCLGEERRWVAMADDCARQVSEHSGRPELDRLAYLQGILKQAGFLFAPARGDHWWLDVPAATPRIVFCILDKARRRLVKRLGGKYRLAYHFGAHWESVPAKEGK